MITSKQINTNVLINRKDTIFLKNELKKKCLYICISLSSSMFLTNILKIHSWFWTWHWDLHQKFICHNKSLIFIINC